MTAAVASTSGMPEGVGGGPTSEPMRAAFTPWEINLR